MECKPNITDFSHELLCQILQYLPLREVLSVAMLCKKMSTAVDMHLRLCKSIDFCQDEICGYMPSAITDDHLLTLLKKCPHLETVYGLHPIKIERRRLRKRAALTIPGIIEALSLCFHLKAIETSDLRLFEAIMQHLPQLEIIGHFQNRDGIFPPQASQRLKLQPYPRISSLHLIGVEIPELTAMPHLQHLHLQCVRFTKLQPFRGFLAQNLKSFVMKHCIGPSVPQRYLSLIIALSSSPSLNHLELVRVPLLNGLFQRAVEDSYRHNGFVNLRTLVISGCKGIFEADLGHLMIVSSKNLETLYIQPALTRDSLFVSLSFAQCSFPKLRNLHLGYIDSLNASGEWSNDALLSFGLAEIPDTPSSITDSGMKVVSQLFPHVKSLSVSNCPHLMVMYQWMAEEDLEAWSRLTDLTLQKCHCLQLSSFALFISFLPNIQVVILNDMFREPPKGCSHVGLSAGTGLGMSSAVVSNQDEYIAVQGHHQDFEHPGDEENEENEREFIDAENDENPVPQFRVLQRDFFDGDNGNRPAAPVDEDQNLASLEHRDEEQRVQEDLNLSNLNNNLSSNRNVSADAPESPSSAPNKFEPSTSFDSQNKNDNASKVKDHLNLNKTQTCQETSSSKLPKNISSGGFKTENSANEKSAVTRKDLQANWVDDYDPHKPSTSKAGTDFDCSGSFDKPKNKSDCNSDTDYKCNESTKRFKSFYERNSSKKLKRSMKIDDDNLSIETNCLANSEREDSNSCILDHSKISKPCKVPAKKMDKDINYFKKDYDSSDGNEQNDASSSNFKNIDSDERDVSSNFQQISSAVNLENSNSFSNIQNISEENNHNVKPIIITKSDQSLKISNLKIEDDSGEAEVTFNKNKTFTKLTEVTDSNPSILFENKDCKISNYSEKMDASAQVTNKQTKKDNINELPKNEVLLCDSSNDLVPDTFPVNTVNFECKDEDPICNNFCSPSSLTDIPISASSRINTNKIGESFELKPCFVHLTKIDNSFSNSGNISYDETEFLNKKTEVKEEMPHSQNSDSLNDHLDCSVNTEHKSSVSEVSSENFNCQPSTSRAGISVSNVKTRNTKKIQASNCRTDTVYRISTRSKQANFSTENISSKKKYNCIDTVKEHSVKNDPENNNPEKASDNEMVYPSTSRLQRSGIAHNDLNSNNNHSYYILVSADPLQPFAIVNSFTGELYKPPSCRISVCQLRIQNSQIRKESKSESFHEKDCANSKNDPLKKRHKEDKKFNFDSPSTSKAESNSNITVKNHKNVSRRDLNGVRKIGKKPPSKMDKVSQQADKACGYSDIAMKNENKHAHKNSCMEKRYCNHLPKPDLSSNLERLHITPSDAAVFIKKGNKKNAFEENSVIENHSLNRKQSSGVNAKVSVASENLSKVNKNCQDKRDSSSSPERKETKHLSHHSKRTRNKKYIVSTKQSKRFLDDSASVPKDFVKKNCKESKRPVKKVSTVPMISLISQGTQATSADIRRSVRRIRRASANRRSVSSSHVSRNSYSSKISSKMLNKRPAKKDPQPESHDKATSTSDPLLEDDAVQTLQLASNTLLSFTVVSCGISDLIIDRCPKLFHIEVQACRILKKFQLKNCQAMKRLNVSQCPKLSICALSTPVLSLNTDSYFLVSYEPCMQGYHPGEGEKAVLSRASINQSVVLCHDFCDISHEGIQAKFKEKILEWLRYLFKLHKVLEYFPCKIKKKVASETILSTEYPWSHDLRKIYGQYSYSSSSTFCDTEGQYQLLTNNPIFCDIFETRQLDTEFPDVFDCEAFKDNSLISKEVLEKYFKMQKKFIGFYIPVTDSNMN